MEKQTSPSIKAYLLRSAFYLLLFLAVCAIPFALAQRNSGKQSVAVNVSAAQMTLPGYSKPAPMDAWERGAGTTGSENTWCGWRLWLYPGQSAGQDLNMQPSFRNRCNRLLML
jgi:hypothetical protein